MLVNVDSNAAEAARTMPLRDRKPIGDGWTWVVAIPARTDVVGEAEADVRVAMADGVSVVDVTAVEVNATAEGVPTPAT